VAFQRRSSFTHCFFNVVVDRSYEKCILCNPTIPVRYGCEDDYLRFPNFSYSKKSRFYATPLAFVKNDGETSDRSQQTSARSTAKLVSEWSDSLHIRHVLIQSATKY
jgi:hypothetical protein